MFETMAVAAVVLYISNRIFKKALPKIRGTRGEAKLAKACKKLKLPGKKKVMRDALFYAEKGGTSQIDVLAVTRYGIFTFENKEYHADIHGSIEDDKWSCFYYGYKPDDPFDHLNKKKNPYFVASLDNPIAQNKTHINALSGILRDKYPRIPYYNLVVFSDKANLHIQNSRDKVCNLRQVKKVVDRIKGPEVLTDMQVEEIAGILDKAQLRGRQARKNHVANIHLNELAKNDYTRQQRLAMEEALLREAKDMPTHSRYGDIAPNPASSLSKNHNPLSETIKSANDRTRNSEPTRQQRTYSR